MGGDSGLKHAEIAVSGMTCSACSTSITQALESMPEVESAVVSLITDRAAISFRNIEVGALVEKIEDCGFDAEVINVKEENNEEKQVKTKVVITVGGMTCAACSTSVRQALELISNVENVEVSLATDEAFVEFAGEASTAQIESAVLAVQDAGFDADLKTLNACSSEPDALTVNLEVRVFGFDESTPILATVKALNGVVNAEFNDYTNVLSVSAVRGVSGIRKIVRAIESLGVTAVAANIADNAQQVEALGRVKELQRYYRDTWRAFILGVPVILITKLRAYLPAFSKTKLARGIWLDDVVCFTLIGLVLLGPARRFYTKSYKTLKSGSSSMDVLVAISVTSAFVYSLLMLVHSIATNCKNHPMYLWDSCVMIIAFVLFGKYLENVARGQTTRALSELISLFPESAHVIAEDTLPEGEDLPVDLLEHGDIVLLRPGEKVSADGVVIQGESYITESLITGEAKPVNKTVGDTVYGGTINGLGSLQFKVTGCGAETKLSQIVSIVKDSQATRAPIQRYTDSVAAVFVPVVVALSMLTFSGWALAAKFLPQEVLPMMFCKHPYTSAFRLAISVVVVACPCALGLATPTAVMVGTGAGARYGILVKGGGVFEMGSQAQVVLFDKTGTLTVGKILVSETTVPAKYWPDIRLLESFSEHIIGKALSSYYHPDEPRPLTTPSTHTSEKVLDEDDTVVDGSVLDKASEKEVVDFEALMGVGIKGRVNGNEIFVGHHEKYDEAVTIVVNDEIVGTVTIRDSVRADSYDVVEMLKLRGYKVGIISGDSVSAVHELCDDLGIDKEMAWGRMKPEDKVEVVKQFTDEGLKVVFIGDGINDSPALVASSLGISLEGATHVAVESADVVLTQASPIRAVPAVLDLCKCTMRRIKINLFASCFYNALMIPVAMGFFLHFGLMLSPMLASAAMALSSISVVISSLMLRSWEPETRITRRKGILSRLLFWRRRDVNNYELV